MEPKLSAQVGDDTQFLAHIGLPTFATPLIHLLQHLVLQLPSVFHEQQHILGGYTRADRRVCDELVESADQPPFIANRPPST